MHMGRLYADDFGVFASSASGVTRIYTVHSFPPYLGMELAITKSHCIGFLAASLFAHILAHRASSLHSTAKHRDQNAQKGLKTPLKTGTDTRWYTTDLEETRAAARR